ncbi:MAG: hypothetical protein AAFX05_09770 [Planctomycetota bacterium]
MIALAKPAESPQDRHFWAFQLFFMLGFLFHAAEEWDHPFETVITILLIWAFLQFDRFREWVFLAFIALLSARNIDKWPGLANHSNILLFICLFLTPQQIRRCFVRPEPGTEQVVATLRWIVLLMYFFAGFHKLNSDFFNPEVSCAFDKMQDYLSVFRVDVEELPAPIQRFVPLSVVLMELLPGILFVWRRTRKIGVAMLLLVHALLAPVQFADFSCVGMSLLWLFVAPDVIDRIPGRRYMSGLAAGLVFMQLFLASERIKTGDAVNHSLEGVLLIVGFAPIWICYFFRTGTPRFNMRLPQAPLHWAAIGFMVFFGMNNYLGLRTAGTLSMFSNLTTEGERSNHYLLGSNPIKFFGFQEDVVELLDVDRRVRGRYRNALRDGHSIPRIEFARILDRLRARGTNNLRLTVLYEGEIYSTSDLVDDESFDFPVPWWQKKYFKFRHIQSAPPQKCCW